MNYLIGIDIGTSSTKAVLFDTAGNIVRQASAEYPLYQPKAGWAEQRPEDWWQAAVKVLKELSDYPIAAVGLSGQMHGLVMLDKDGNVLRNAIIWCDQRTIKECEEITAKLGSRLIDITGNPALTGFTASKIMWVRNNEPEIYERCAKILLPKDYIRYKLSGIFATEVSDASGMQLLDIRKRDWSDEVLNALEIDEGLLADVYESQYISSVVSPEAASVTGLAEGTSIGGGAGDQAAAAIGMGIVAGGDTSLTLGSSGVVFSAADSPIIDKKGRIHSFCHAIPGGYHIMGVTQGAGLSIKWYKDILCKEEQTEAKKKRISVYKIIDTAIAATPVGSNGVYYLPYLMGERTPHLDPYARGVFFGMSGATVKADMSRAVMEGVCYSLKDCLEVIRENKIKAGITQIKVNGIEGIKITTDQDVNMMGIMERWIDEEIRDYSQQGRLRNTEQFLRDMFGDMIADSIEIVKTKIDISDVLKDGYKNGDKYGYSYFGFLNYLFR